MRSAPGIVQGALSVICCGSCVMRGEWFERGGTRSSVDVAAAQQVHGRVVSMGRAVNQSICNSCAA